MLYVTHSPGPPLSEFVECFWLLAGAQTPRKERILPSGTIELVVNLHEDEMRIHHPARPDRDGPAEGKGGEAGVRRGLAATARSTLMHAAGEAR